MSNANIKVMPPNVNQHITESVADMVNILTNPLAAPAFQEELDHAVHANGDSVLGSGIKSRVYDSTQSDLMRHQLSLAKSRACHTLAPGIMGMLVNPGCVSFYEKDGMIFCAPEGRWFLPSLGARWMTTNVSILSESAVFKNVHFVRVPPGTVAEVVFNNGQSCCLGTGLHVFQCPSVGHQDMTLSRRVFDYDSYNANPKMAEGKNEKQDKGKWTKRAKAAAKFTGIVAAGFAAGFAG